MCATLVASTDEIPAVGSYLLTVREPDGSLEEVILLDLEDGVSAWKNYQVYLTDDDLEFVAEGGIDDDGSPSSTSHLSF
ncbi:hypothetical protein BRD02_00475 [Halobacteriales archaeon QS_8_69_73]|nr:MAG: hypothetical protein BRD02_00475 [Halobacteriales archaeon QS_8_69_73]